jgi:hypothetical protein
LPLFKLTKNFWKKIGVMALFVFFSIFFKWQIWPVKFLYLLVNSLFYIELAKSIGKVIYFTVQKYF